MESLQVSLFEEENKEDEEENPNIFRPLADRMRPETLDEYVGQKQLVAKGNLLQKMIENDQITSMIFWGPPGVGKTTLAQIIARQTRSHFINFSAVQSGIKEIREVMKKRNRTGMRMRKRSYSWMRSIASTKRSRTLFCRMWKREASS